MLSNQNDLGNGPVSSQGAVLGQDTSTDMLNLMEPMGQSGISPAYQDPAYDLAPLPQTTSDTPLPLGGLDLATIPAPEVTDNLPHINPDLDQLTGQDTGQIQSISAQLTSNSSPIDQVLWGVDAKDSQLFRIGDYNDPIGSFEDFGLLQIIQKGRAFNIKRVNAFTIDQDNQTAYIAVNRRAGKTRGPWIGSIDLSALQKDGPNEVTVVGQVDLRQNEDRRATIRGLDFDPISGELYALLNEKGNDDLTILDKQTGQIKTNLGSIHTGSRKVTSGEDLVFDGQGNLYVIDAHDDELYRVDKTTADILETVDSQVEKGLGNSRRNRVEVEGLAWDPIAQQMILTEERQDLLGVLSLESGNNQTIATTTSIGLLDVEGIDFQTIESTGNIPPEAIADSYTLDEDTSLSILAATGVLSNDTDVDGGSLTATVVSPTSNGLLSLASDGSFTYTPDPNFNGADSFTYQVSDGQGSFDSATVDLLINPVNDAPIIDDQSLTIDENSPNGTTVGTVTATDPDMGDVVSYSITGGTGNGIFSLDAETGAIAVIDDSALDFETTPSFTLDVEVTDSEGLSDTATVTINLNDLPENGAPNVDDQSFTLEENSADGTNVGTIIATDPNAGDSLTYSILSGNDGNIFSLDASTGKLTANNPPGGDFESQDLYNLIVQVEDSAGLTDTANITINLLDVNEAPSLGDQSFSIAEDSANGLIVGTISGSDPDIGDSVSYSITAGNEAGAFDIDASTGDISVVDSSQLDFETQPVYSLTIDATDSSNLSDTGTVTINLTDVDDGNQPPVIVTTPVTEIALGETVGGEAIDLSAWSPVNYPGSQGEASWEILNAENTLLRQTQNSAPSVYIGDFELTNSKVSGSWKVDTSSDDDLMGFVFGYQDSEHFYLFDWKQNSQSASIGFAEEGMSIKVVNANSPLTSADFWPTEGVPGRVTNLYKNDMGWDDFTEYDFSIEFLEGSFTITVSETVSGTVLESVTLEDDTYTDGKFGFYNYSQDSVEYRGFTQESLILDTYSYDVDATDADGDTLTYDLVSAPEGMVIDASTGVISWELLADDVGAYNVEVAVTDGNGGTDLQTYQLNVTDATNGNPA